MDRSCGIDIYISTMWYRHVSIMWYPPTFIDFVVSICFDFIISICIDGIHPIMSILFIDSWNSLYPFWHPTERLSNISKERIDTCIDIHPTSDLIPPARMAVSEWPPDIFCSASPFLRHPRCNDRVAICEWRIPWYFAAQLLFPNRGHSGQETHSNIRSTKNIERRGADVRLQISAGRRQNSLSLSRPKMSQVLELINRQDV